MAKKILVIDDEELLIKTMNRLLEKKGYQVYSTKNSADAEVLVEEEGFDLLICDIRMPGRNGVDVAKSILAIRKMPVIFVTGFADDLMEKEAMKLQPAAYLMKPFDVTEILTIIEKALKA